MIYIAGITMRFRIVETIMPPTTGARFPRRVDGSGEALQQAGAFQLDDQRAEVARAIDGTGWTKLGITVSAVRLCAWAAGNF
jgi:hypothetical protein